MATKTAQKRLIREFKDLQETPTAYIEAHPNDSNILEWYYIITGPPDSPYEGGQYMGTLTFPADYPFNPPAIRMLTPSGRFEPGVRLCLSISDYHPKTWNPSWSVSTILVGLLSFMTSKEQTAGSLNTSDDVKRQLARQTHAWNSKNPRFEKQFPDLWAEQIKALRQEPAASAPSVERSSSRAQPPPTWLYLAGAAIILSTLYKVM